MPKSELKPVDIDAISKILVDNGIDEFKIYKTGHRTDRPALIRFDLSGGELRGLNGLPSRSIKILDKSKLSKIYYFALAASHGGEIEIYDINDKLRSGQFPSVEFSPDEFEKFLGYRSVNNKRESKIGQLRAIIREEIKSLKNK